MDEEKYAQRCTERMRSVLDYTRSIKFHSDICIASLSSIPRWRFARALEDREATGTSPRLGTAMRAFYASTCSIIRGGDLLTEHLINRDPNAGTLRLSLYGSLMRAYLYLAERNGVVM